MRRKNLTENKLDEIVAAIMLELEGAGIDLGYRAMCERIKKVYGICVKQKTVLSLLQKMDPEGVEGRCRYRLKRRLYYVPGPNFVWHADGHDKLKKFGFSIYGIVNGFSRKEMLLDIATTNKDPKVVGHMYLSLIEKKIRC